MSKPERGRHHRQSTGSLRTEGKPACCVASRAPARMPSRWAVSPPSARGPGGHSAHTVHPSPPADWGDSVFAGPLYLEESQMQLCRVEQELWERRLPQTQRWALLPGRVHFKDLAPGSLPDKGVPGSQCWQKFSLLLKSIYNIIHQEIENRCNVICKQ